MHLASTLEYAQRISEDFFYLIARGKTVVVKDLVLFHLHTFKNVQERNATCSSIAGQNVQVLVTP